MFRISLLLSLLLTILCVSPVDAWAQFDDDDDPIEFEPESIDDDDGGEFGGGTSPVGSNENPDSSTEFGVEETVKPSELSIGYPVEVIKRPLTLAAGMFEMAVEVPSYIGPVRSNTHVRASYGITRQIQISVEYGPGTATADEFVTGKGMGVEYRQLLTDFLSLQLGVPMYADPFSIGLIVGIPMRFGLGDKAALFIGEDLLSFKMYRFVPSVEDARYNEAQVAKDKINETTSFGDVRIVGGAMYQYRPNVVLKGEFGWLPFDYSIIDAGYLLRGTLIYSPYRSFDIGVRVGFDNLDEAGSTFGVSLSAALRI